MRIVLVSLTKANQFIKKNGRGLNYSLEGESMNIIMMSRKVDKTLEPAERGGEAEGGREKSERVRNRQDEKHTHGQRHTGRIYYGLLNPKKQPSVIYLLQKCHPIFPK